MNNSAGPDLLEFILWCAMAVALVIGSLAGIIVAHFAHWGACS